MRSRVHVTAIIVIGLAIALSTACARKTAPTDAQIATDVQTKVYGDAAIQSREIGVQAAAGIVTLSGTVSSDSERAAAAADAATVAGVKTVVNNLQIQQARLTEPSAPVEQQPAPKPQKARNPKSESKPKKHHSGDNGNSKDEEALNNPPSVSPTPPVQQSQPTTPAAPVQPPPPPPPPQKVTIPAGTQLTVRLNDTLDSEKNQVGDTWHGTLSAPVSLDGETVVPSGADVVGRVADVKSAGRFAGNSVLTIEVTSLMVNGKSYSVQTNQWSRSGKGEGKNTAVKVGGGAALGAIIGGLAGGGKGAAIGSVAGAGAGTGVSAAKKGQQIKLAPESTLNFQTINTVTVVPQNSNARDAGRTPLTQ